MSTDHTETPRCTATAKSTRERCKRRPVPGANVCVKHGGKAPQVQAAAARRLAERDAEQAAKAFGLPRVIDPHTAFVEELHRAAGSVQWLGGIVADLEQDDVGWGKIRKKTGGEDHGTTYEARPNVWVSMWQAERVQLVKVAKACIDIGIEERRVRLAEAAGQQLASVVRAVLDRLELTDEQRVLALTVVPEEFRKLATGDGEGGAGA